MSANAPMGDKESPAILRPAEPTGAARTGLPAFARRRLAIHGSPGCRNVKTHDKSCQPLREDRHFATARRQRSSGRVDARGWRTARRAASSLSSTIRMCRRSERLHQREADAQGRRGNARATAIRSTLEPFEGDVTSPRSWTPGRRALQGLAWTGDFALPPICRGPSAIPGAANPSEPAARVR
jgi:hypothetical protein